jgi:hypothetical protein
MPVFVGSAKYLYSSSTQAFFLAGYTNAEVENTTFSQKACALNRHSLVCDS